MRAVADIQRLRLFPVVFAAPQPLRGALGDDYGAPCATLLAEAAALIETLHAEVHSHTLCMWRLARAHMNAPCLDVHQQLGSKKHCLATPADHNRT